MASNENTNLELITLIWLDKMVNGNEENRQTQDKLRSIINYLETFDNCLECEDYIRNRINDKQDKIILIVSGRLGEEIIERIHQLKQIISIYVYCFDKEKNQIWANKYQKIRGVIVELNDLLKEIDLDRQSEEHKSIELVTNDNEIISLLLQIPSTSIDKKYLLNICLKEYQKSSNQLESIRDFEHLYLSSNALNYFLNETFLYRLLIKSVYIFNIEILYLLRFFLQDIDEQLKTCSTISGKVYRGQLMTIDQIHSLTQSQENPIRFNSFIIANQNQEQVRKSLQNFSNTNNFHRVLFEIDQNQIGKQYKEYIIFPITTSFKIYSVTLENRIWIVKISVIDNSNQTLQKKDFNSIQLAQYLREIGHLDQAEKLFELLLNQYPSLHSQCYHGLGRIAQDKGFYEISLNFYLKSLQTVSNDERSFCLNNIGCAYDYLEQYEEALQFYSQALTTMKSDVDKSMCLNNMGITYAKLDQYDQALQCFQDSLSIRERYLSPNHPDIGICYTNIGVISSSRDQLDDALKNYQLALKCFSINNSVQIFRAIVYQNMGEIFQNKNQFPRALTSYQDAHNIFQQFRPIDHPNVVYLQQQIEQMKQLK